MDKFEIVGGKALQGEVNISGAKNAALPIILATLLTSETVILHNVPDLRDVKTCFKLLTMMGKSYEQIGDNSLRSVMLLLAILLLMKLVKTMRASILALVPINCLFRCS